MERTNITCIKKKDECQEWATNLVLHFFYLHLVLSAIVYCSLLQNLWFSRICGVVVSKAQWNTGFYVITWSCTVSAFLAFKSDTLVHHFETSHTSTWTSPWMLHFPCNHSTGTPHLEFENHFCFFSLQPSRKSCRKKVGACIPLSSSWIVHTSSICLHSHGIVAPSHPFSLSCKCNEEEREEENEGENENGRKKWRRWETWRR